MKKFFITTLLTIILIPSVAQAGSFSLRRHDITLSGAVYPARLAYGSNSPGMIFSGAGIKDIYNSTGYYYKLRTTGTWTLTYTYNFTKVIGLQASMSYEDNRRTIFLREDGTKVSTSKEQFITPMVALRISWLNRRLVRLYSSVGLGATVNISREPTSEAGKIMPQEYNLLVAAQLTMIGISIGKKLYGFGEAGLGHLNPAICAGIGYRF